MGKPYSLVLREWIIGFVDGGGSRRGAGGHALFTAKECWNFFRHNGYASDLT
jgi:hypothetical protein